MNPIIKIINQTIILINRLIDNFDKKTVETIKHSFYFLIFVLLIIGIVIGYNHGKQSAKMYGKPLNETTNSIFDVKIKRNSGTGRFRSMLDSELSEEKKELHLKKIELPANEKQLKPEFDNKIIESGNLNNERPMHLKSDNIAETENTNKKIITSDVPKLKKSDTQTLKEKTENNTRLLNKEFKIIEK
ncbi:MAG: hypothetical protein JW864_09395 [Spirochaetes bacterium]|nr:hypothetical protein [Spirochaetota bacterium]